MGSVLSRDLFHVGFFGAAAELRLGFAFRSMLDRISPQFPPLFFLFALSQFCGPDYLGAWNSLPPRQSEKTGVFPRRLTLCRLVEKKSKICDWDCCANKQRKQVSNTVYLETVFFQSKRTDSVFSSLREKIAILRCPVSFETRSRQNKRRKIK